MSITVVRGSSTQFLSPFFFLSFGRRPCRKSTAQTIHWSAQVKGNKITISHDKFIIVSGRANAAAAAAAAALLRLLLDP